MTAERVPTITIPYPSREHPRAKAARFLLEGRVTVLTVHGGRVRANVKGDTATHRCGFDPTRGWWCHCPEMKGRCSHLLALASIVDVSAWEGGINRA